MSHGPAWTPADDAELTRRWGLGETAPRIAEAMPGRSRMAVIGRANRLGLPARKLGWAGHQVAERKAARARAVAAKEALAPKPAIRPPTPIRPTPAPFTVDLFALRPEHCRWVDDGRGAAARYCGGFVREEHRSFAPYCAEHRLRALARSFACEAA